MTNLLTAGGRMRAPGKKAVWLMDRIGFIAKKTGTGVTGRVAMMLLAAALIWCSGGCSGEKSGSEGKAAKTQAPAPSSARVNKSGDPATGKDIYLQHCHFCHGRTGRGDGPVGIAISPHPADFVNDAKRMGKTDEELFESISKGIQKEIGGEEMAMPRWQEILTEQERWDVLSYVRLLEREGKASRKKGD